MEQRLRMVSSHCLGGCLFPFRQSDGNCVPGTSCEVVWRCYVFDLQLGVLLPGCP